MLLQGHSPGGGGGGGFLSVLKNPPPPDKERSTRMYENTLECTKWSTITVYLINDAADILLHTVEDLNKFVIQSAWSCMF